jgi:hypothetical protein
MLAVIRNGHFAGMLILLVGTSKREGMNLTASQLGCPCRGAETASLYLPFGLALTFAHAKHRCYRSAHIGPETIQCVL